MAIKCQYCGSEFSTQPSGNCPNCGGVIKVKINPRVWYSDEAQTVAHYYSDEWTYQDELDYQAEEPEDSSRNFALIMIACVLLTFFLVLTSSNI